MSNHTLRVVVAIPVCNERDKIIGCLDALSDQVGVDRANVAILLFLNNCSDGTREVVERWRTKAPCSLRLVERDCNVASAGWARREAMDAAAQWMESLGIVDGALLTTDADSRVPSDWIARNQAELAAGADAVAGRVVFDPEETVTFPTILRQRHRDELEYETLLAEIKARLHPGRGDPWPCHMANSGASIAVRLAAFRSVGGIPAMTGGEDRAFIERLLLNGFVVRHAPDIVVTTSGRLDGRAHEGTAATLKRQLRDADSPCDIRLERLTTFVFRLLGRRLLRRIGAGPEDWRSTRRPLQPRELPKQIRRARWLVKVFRGLAARPNGIPPSASDLLMPEPKQLSTP